MAGNPTLSLQCNLQLGFEGLKTLTQLKTKVQNWVKLSSTWFHLWTTEYIILELKFMKVYLHIWETSNGFKFPSKF
jgi:hypothetical protein